MPEAVSSNTTLAPKIQSASLINCLRDLSCAFYTCKIMFEKLFDDRNIQEIADMRRRIMQHAGMELGPEAEAALLWKALADYRGLLKYLEKRRGAVDAGDIVDWLERKIRRQLDLPGVRETGVEDVRSVRDAFIAMKIQKGFSAEQISQSLNMRLSAIRRVMERIRVEQEL